MSRRTGSQRTEPLLRSIRALTFSTEGGTAIEYALLAALVAMVLIGALGGLGDAIRDLPMSAIMDAFASVLS